MKETLYTRPEFRKGQKIKLEDGDQINEHTILNILDSQKVADVLNLGYQIQNPTKIVILDGVNNTRQAAYHKGFGVIFAFNDTDPQVLHHEIIHSLEIQYIVPDGLVELYEEIKNLLPDTKNINPNWRKDIHEFIADAYSKQGFIETLKEIGVYDNFLKHTQYIFK